jgi:hypothetical protein
MRHTRMLLLASLFLQPAPSDVASVGASYVGVLNAAGTELAGTWTQGPAVLPLTFRRAAK